MTNRRRIHRGTALVLVTAAMSLAACGDDDSTDTTIGTTTTEASVTTTEAATTTPTMSDPTTTESATVVDTTSTSTVPVSTSPPSSDQIDWIPIVEDLYNRKFALFTAPDVSRIGEVAAAGSPVYETMVTDLTEYVANGWHDAPFESWEVARVDVEDAAAAPDRTVVRATLVYWHAAGKPGATLDAEGKLVFPVTVNDPPPGMLNRVRIRIERAGADQPWLFVEESRIEPAAP